jgi:ribosomal protein S18 acetylase RimI-like enzyme
VAPEHTEIATALRPCGPEDREFLVRVYASTRADELALTGWSEEECEAFVRMQFDLQDRTFAAAFPDAERSIVVDGDTPIGRLYVHRDEREIRIVDVTLLPEHRGRGVGTALLRDLLAEGERSSRSVRLHVGVFNPARALYDRLGFVPLGEFGVHVEMERSA